jgi:hypothetical protein
VYTVLDCPSSENSSVRDPLIPEDVRETHEGDETEELRRRVAQMYPGAVPLRRELETGERLTEPGGHVVFWREGGQSPMR